MGFIQPKTVDKAMIAADPTAALIGYLSMVLATFGVFEALSLTADQVAILGGAILGLLATFRHFYEQDKREVLETLQGVLKRQTNELEEPERPAAED